MNSRLCDELGIEFPLFAFSHCRDVVAAVSAAGGFGVLGAAGHSPETLDIELSWIDEHVGGKPYGVDLLIPTSMDSKDRALTAMELEERIPPEHKRYIESLLAQHDIDTTDLWEDSARDGLGDNMREVGASLILDAAFAHPVKMVVNALGVPPAYMFDRARAAGAKVGALAGAREHAVKHAEAGVDVIIVAGTEAGGHCGEVSTMVLIPEVIQALAEDHPDQHIPAAGGIVTGRQMAAAMAMGADGVDRQRLADDRGSGNVAGRQREDACRQFAPDRALAQPDRQVHASVEVGLDRRLDGGRSPEPLAMPLQGVLAGAAFRKINKLAESDHAGAKQLVNYYVGQGVGLMNESMSARSVVYQFMEDFAEAAERLQTAVDE